MIVICGLGNPGRKYTDARHNVGFTFLDKIKVKYKFNIFKKSKSAEVFSGKIKRKKCYLLKPLTYMNLSGTPIASFLQYYKIPIKNLTVVHDDLDLSPGKVRVKAGGGSAGHNGLRSLDSHIGREYRRIRIGIGHPVDNTEVSDFVLSDFAKDDRSWLDKLIPALVEAIPFVLRGDGAGFTNKVSLLINSKLEGSSSKASARATGKD